MAKIKKKSIYTPLVVSGYILFGLLIISVLLSTTLPFTLILFNPHSIKVNATIAMLSLTIGALLPVLVGYFAGGRSLKSKSKLRHHFNGMLFGLLAYWLMIGLVGFIPIPSELFANKNMQMVAANIVPSIIIGIVLSVLAVLHVRSRKSGNDLMEYPAFLIILIVAIIAVPVAGLINSSITNSVNVYSFIPLGVVLIFGFIAHLSLYRLHLSGMLKVAWQAVAISVLFIIVFVTNMFATSVTIYLFPMSTMETQLAIDMVAGGLAVAGWIVYWVYQMRALRDGKK